MSSLIDINILEYGGIKLRTDWQIKLIPYSIISNYKHEDNCAIHSWTEESNLDIDEICNCNPIVRLDLVAKLLGWPVGNPKREYHYVSIPYGPISDFKEKVEEPFNKFSDIELLVFLSTMPTKDWPKILQEDFDGGMITLFTFLKYNEATGNVLTEEYWFEHGEEVDNVIYERV